MTRFKAFAIHLLVSSLILGCFLALTYFVWYPEPFFSTEGLASIVMLLVAVDVVLGPSLTLVVYKKGKPGLKRDLSIIFAIQILGFIYGANTIFTERPYFAIFADSSDYFDVVSASNTESLDKLDPQLTPSVFSGPSYVYVETPKDLSVLKKILNEMKAGAPSIQERLEFYRPLKGYINNKFNFAKNIDDLTQIPNSAEAIAKFRLKYKDSINAISIFRITGRASSRLVVIDNKDESVVDYLDIDPMVKSNLDQ